MNLIFLFRRLVFAQVLLGVVAFCWAAIEPGLLLVAGALIGLSWYVVEGPTGRPLPRVIINLGSFIAVIWLFVALFAWQTEVIPAMGQFTLWLQVVLLYAEKSNRDYGQLMVLSLLQMIAASILSVQFFFGLLLIAYCAVALFSVLLLHLKSTSDMVMEKNQTAAPRGVRVARPPAVIGPGYRWHFRFAALWIGVACVLVSIVVFLIIPRSQAVNTFAAPLAGATTGFNDRVKIDEPAPMRGSESPALILELTKDGQRSLKLEDVMPDGSDFALLRGAALDQYDANSHTWSRSLSSSGYDKTHNFEEDGELLVTLPEETETVQLDITLRHATQQTLFTLPPTVGVSSRNLEEVVFNAYDQQMAMKEPLRGVITYSTLTALNPPKHLFEQYQKQAQSQQQSSSASRFSSGGASGYGSAYSMDPLEFAGRWTAHIERIRELAQDILEERNLGPRDINAPASAEDAARVQAFHAWLQRFFTYSLENPVPKPHEDPMLLFLFDRRAGHCELFASGLAALCRSVGIPARVITGYRVSEFNPYGDYYVVRHAHAHAWNEAYLGEQEGWVTFDATPPAEVDAEHAAASGGMLGLRQAYEYLEFLWLKNVVSMNRAEQAQTWRDIGSMGPKPERQWLQRVIDWAKTRWDQLNISTPMLIFAGIIGLFIIIGVANLIHSAAVRRRRMVTLQLTRLPRKQRRHLVKQLRFYLYMLDLLDRYGLTRPSWQSPFRFAQDLMVQEPDAFRPVLTLTEQFYEVRFGHRDLDDERKANIREQLTTLEKNLMEMKSDILNAARGKE